MTQWRKSSYSGTTAGTDCVELAPLTKGVGVRDSTAPDTGHLSITRTSFSELLKEIKNSEHDI